MTDQPPPRPTGSEYAEHIRAVVERAATTAAAENTYAPTQGSGLTRAPLVVALSVAFSAVVVWNVRVWSPAPDPLPAPVQERALGISLLVATQMVEQYREDRGVLPETLEEAGIPPAAFTYRRDGDEYELFASEGGVTVRYDSLDGPRSLLDRLGAPSPPDGDG